MAYDVVVSPNPILDRDPRLARQFERVVVEALRGHGEPSEGGAAQVRFSVWEGEDIPRYVCKVEWPSTPSLDMGEPPWRWWSGLVETPQELAQALREALRARQLRSRRGAGEHAAAPPERWGWAGEMQLR